MMKLGILLSGSGRTLLNLDKHIRDGLLDAEISIVISSSSKCMGLERARDLGVPVYVVRKKKSMSDNLFSQIISDKLEEHGAEIVVLAGFLKRYLPSKRFEHTCINIHPSLIPAFCGPGFYGSKVHQAVWDRGCSVSGCTVHFINREYDAGPIILQKTVDLVPEDTPDLIAKKVFQKECEALPEAIQYVIKKKLKLINGRVYKQA